MLHFFPATCMAVFTSMIKMPRACYGALFSSVHSRTECLVARPAVLVSSRANGSYKTSAEMHRKVGDVDREAQHTWRSCIKGRRLAVDGAVDGVRERAVCRRPRRIAQQHKLALEADAEVDAIPLARQADDFAQRIPRAALPVCVCASRSRLAGGLASAHLPHRALAPQQEMLNGRAFE